MSHAEALQCAIDWMSRQLDGLDRMSHNRAIVKRFRATYTERRRLLVELMPAAEQMAARTAPGERDEEEGAD